jgi:hypothetical protein
MGEAAPQAAQGNTAVTGAGLAGMLGSITVDMLRETFDQWTIGETADRFLAIRAGYFAAFGPRSLIRGCVMAGTATGLAEQLGIQAWLESLSAAELKAVWQSGPTAGWTGDGASL